MLFFSCFIRYLREFMFSADCRIQAADSSFRPQIQESDSAALKSRRFLLGICGPQKIIKESAVFSPQILAMVSAPPNGF